MVKVLPLEGISYNLDKVKASEVVAPPYDVISSEEQDELYNLSPYNIVRLILNKKTELDNQENNRYTRASECFKAWQEENALIKSDKPIIYYYIQNYKDSKGNKISRKGFIARNEIEEFAQGNILPHEYTMGGPKEDRLLLTKACKANFSPIFMIYSDPEKKIDKALKLSSTPFMDVTDKNGVQNIVYIIDDKDSLNQICEIMKDKTLLIADGHHRYETALAYRNFMRSNTADYNENDNFNFVLSYFTNLDDEGLVVYPTHRIVKKAVNKDELLEKMSHYFDITEYSTTRDEFINIVEEKALDKITFGIYIKGVNVYYLAELKDVNAVNSILEKKEVPDVLKKLDLTVLHKIIISEYIAISEEDQMKQNGIKYIKKVEEAFEAVDNNTAELVFLMASPKISDIKDVSQAGYRMPQKSTYFYPKLLSGIAINPLQ